MCGIVGYVGGRHACPVLVKGLRRLEYRGYDSAGVALVGDDGNLNVYKCKGKIDALILPGGMPGAKNLDNSSDVDRLIEKTVADGGHLAAICAAPVVLQRAGLSAGKRLTGYPGTNQGLADLAYTGSRTERDGNIVTGKGPGVSFEFGARIAEALGADPAKIKAVLDGMFVLR